MTVKEPLPEGTVTFLFTDIEDSTRLLQRLGERYVDLLAEHHHLLRAAFHGAGGYEMDAHGEEEAVVFVRASDAVAAAVAAQRSLAAHSWPGGVVVRVRIGMHTGEAALTVSGYVGLDVHRAARIGAVGHGGQVVVSDATRLLALAELPPEITFRDLGVHRLRSIGEERLWQVCHPDLPTDFPPLRTLDLGRHSLPVPATPFVGREAEMSAWYERLRRPETRLLTLTGFGGVGKTRAALQLAELCLETFPDGVWWVELEEARTGEAMIHRIAQRLGLRLQPQLPEREQLASWLRERQMLLVLDNTEQIPDAAEAVQELLSSAPRIRCLATTRRALGLPVEQVVEVPPLPPSEAERLFAERARARKADFALTAENAADVRELCRRLEGMPLAIELAASRIVGMSPREIAHRLDERFRLLQTRAPGLPSRQRALRGAIDWSYDLLTAEDQNLFAQLAAFAGGFTLADAEAVCEAFDVIEGLMELRRHSLLSDETGPETQETRFLMLESVREYAMEKLQAKEDGGQSVRKRHAEHFLRFAREQIRHLRTPGEVMALNRFEAGLENVRSAMDGSQQSGQPGLCAEIALRLGIYLQRRGFQREALHRIQVGMEVAGQAGAGAAPLYSQLLRECAGLHIDRFEWTAARQRAGEALELFEQSRDEVGQADAHNLMGLAAHGEQGFGEARRCFARALALFERQGDRVGIARAHNNLGRVEYEDAHGRREQAAHHWQQTLQLHRESGDLRGIAEALNNLGVLAQEEGDRDRAWRHYQESLQFEQELRNASGVARALSNLGEVAELNGDVARACRLFAAAETLFDEVGSPYREYTGGLLQQATSQLQYMDAEVEELRRGFRNQSLDERVSMALTE
jgi:predicted ATPase/class 3 adenylate cyclase